MKAIWFVFIFMICGNCFAQEVDKVSVDTVRVKGYFVIDTYKSDRMSDTPFVYFFIELKDMENGFKSAFIKRSDLQNSGEIFFTEPYISDTLDFHNLTLKKD
ncbi:hypothetical protein [Flavobacterium sp. C4GT6]|uniref:hypothetical protein n=1 Tax=Flavobacterium sp. C4GT6 TaxID=3103818 RepID=UPI002ED4DB13